MFQDITTLLLDHKAFKHTIDIFVDRYKDMQISVVAGKKNSCVFYFFFFLFLSTVFRHQVCLITPKKSRRLSKWDNLIKQQIS